MHISQSFERFVKYIPFYTPDRPPYAQKQPPRQGGGVLWGPTLSSVILEYGFSLRNRGRKF